MKNRIFITFLTSLLVCIFLCVGFGCSGCDTFRRESYMQQYMNSIELEYDGYYLSNEEKDECAKVIGIQLPATISLKDKTLYVDVLEDESFKGYTVQIDNQTIEITIDYFKSQSEAFNKALKMWEGYEDEGQQVQNIDIGPIFVFDSEVFVCASYIPPKWIVDWRGKIPLILYHFDINDHSLQYAGYSDRYIFNGYICKK